VPVPILNPLVFKIVVYLRTNSIVNMVTEKISKPLSTFVIIVGRDEFDSTAIPMAFRIIRIIKK
jgi:hypothetical protein